MARVVLVAVLLAGCLESNLVACENGLLCPVGTQCDLVHQQCVTEAQQAACASLADGATCSAGELSGICDGSVCIPGCGDGVQSGGEECDDGNFRSHDGCSSTCAIEVALWTQWQSPWVARTNAIVAYLESSGRLLVAGGMTANGNSEGQWLRDSARNWTFDPISPRLRVGSAAAYDSTRHRLVVLTADDNEAGEPINGTWELSAAGWEQIAVPMTPTPRKGAAMVFDPVRSRIVIWGGSDGINNLDDTWEYDGTTWTRIATTGTPPGRSNHSMTWDAKNQRAIMYGGAAVSTWQYIHPVWTQVGASGPSSRTGARVAFMPAAGDPANGDVIMFGGRFASGQMSSETWRLSGTTTASTWTVLQTPTAPGGRALASLAYDGGKQRLVLVGGSDVQGNELRDVWEFDGTSWVETSPDFSPEPRFTQIAYDAARNHIVLYGGSNTLNQRFADTWLFDGIQWRKRPDDDQPAHRYLHALDYDSTRSVVVMAGGMGLFSVVAEDIWEWDGNTWTSQPLSGPPPRYSPSLADNPAGGSLVMLGGADPTPNPDVPFNDTWELAGTTWTARDTPFTVSPGASRALVYDRARSRMITVDASGDTWAFSDHAWSRVPTTTSPPVRQGAGFVYDPIRDRVLRYGGADAAQIVYGDVWELAGDTWQELRVYGELPPPRLAAALAPLPDARAIVMFGGRASGDTWLLRLVSDTPDEACDNGVDDDGDRQIDDADADCS